MPLAWGVLAANALAAFVGFGRFKFLDLDLIQELDNYIIDMRPPTGGNLLAAPVGGEKSRAFRSTPYTNQSAAYKKAHARAYPEAGKLELSRVGGTSCRKSLATWLWDDDWDKRVIADQGGWALQRDAVDLYFKTGLKKMLWAITNLGHVQRARERKLLDSKPSRRRGDI